MMKVVDAADLVGSTEFIIKTIEQAPAGSTWGVGTELHLVNRLAQEHPDQRIHFLSPMVCMCATMYRIDLPASGLVPGESGTEHACEPIKVDTADGGMGADRPGAYAGSQVNVRRPDPGCPIRRPDTTASGMTMPVKTMPVPMTSAEDVELIVHGDHWNPFSILGLHEISAGGVGPETWVIRAFMPEARTAWVVNLARGEPGERVAMERVHPDGFFTAAFPIAPSRSLPAAGGES